MNILLIVPSLRLGGAERQIVEIANSLPSHGFNVHLITFETGLGLREFLDETKVTFHYHLRKKKIDYSLIKYISSLIDREKIDIVHCTLQFALFYGYLSLLFAKRNPKLIDAVHTTINRNTKLEIIDRILYLPIMRRCDRIIMVCGSQKEHWVAKYPDIRSKISTVHNGIDTEYFNDNLSCDEKKILRRQLGIDPDDIVIGVIAGLRHEKNHRDIFIAFKRLLDTGLSLKLLLVGDGDQRQILEAFASELGIKSYIIWIGFTNDVKQYLSVLDVGVLFSYAVETFSMAILEIMAMGKPVVAADIGGTNEMIVNGVNGFLVPIRDVDSLIYKMQIILNDLDLMRALGVAARMTVLNNFTKSKMVQKTIDVISNA